jgi:hypothetical protein
MDLNVVHHYSLPGVAIRLFETGNQKFSNKLIKLARLPKNLWPEVYRAANDIINISPTKSLEWKMPHEVLKKAPGSKDTVPRASSMKVYGCTAYFRDTHIKQIDNLWSRCLIGYLVGYGASDIYRVWNPKTNWVIRTRDVWFDETKIFNPDESRTI